MFTKAEIEDIWENKPVGYIKNLKGMKRFKFTFTPFEEVRKEPESITIFAKKKNDVEYNKEVSKFKASMYDKYRGHKFLTKIEEL